MMGNLLVLQEGPLISSLSGRKASISWKCCVWMKEYGKVSSPGDQEVAVTQNDELPGL